MPITSTTKALRAKSAPARPTTVRCTTGRVDPRAVLQAALGPGGVAPATLDRMAAVAAVRELTAGRTLWRTGESAAWLTVIARGMMKIARRMPTGESVTMGIFGPRDAVGLLAVIDGIDYPADAIALSKHVVVVTVPVAVVHTALETDPALARALMSRVANHARFLHNKIHIVSSGSVPARLATLLLSLADRYGDELENGDTCIPIDMTRRTMAEFIEARVETVIRTMSAWQTKGIVRGIEEGIAISDLAAMRTIASGG
jgi:CRP-like cAMP-binding protein